MDRFLADAHEIFDVARTAGLSANGGEAYADFTLLIGADGGIRMIAETAIALETLTSWHGSSVAYRVTRGTQGVRLEGRTRTRKCMFEESPPESRRFSRLPDEALYSVISPLAIGSGEYAGDAGGSASSPVASAIFLENRGEPASTIPQSM